MDEMVFTNPEGPKVTPHQERSGTAGWAAFTAKWPPSLKTPIIIRQGMTAGIELSCPAAVSDVSAGATWRAGTDAQEFI
jgi:hypothetical protein